MYLGKSRHRPGKPQHKAMDAWRYLTTYRTYTMKLQSVSTTQPPAETPRHIPPRDRLLRLGDVESLTATKKSTIYKLMKEGKFPKCINITRRMAAWSEAAVLQWVQDRINTGAV
jgi:prophage regulatory protein